MESEFQIDLPSKIEHATTASSSFLFVGKNMKMEKRTESGKHSTSINEQIEHSKCFGANWQSQILISPPNGLNYSRIVMWAG